MGDPFFCLSLSSVDSGGDPKPCSSVPPLGRRRGAPVPSTLYPASAPNLLF